MKACLCILLLIGSFFCCTGVTAQIKPFSFGVYGEALVPEEKDLMNTGFGGGLDFHFKLPVKFTITGSAGFVHFAEKTISSTIKTEESNAIPVRLGLRYRYSIFYIKFESGAIVSTQGEKTKAILSPGLGLKFSSIDLQGKYELWTNDGDLSFLGVKLAIHF